MDDEGLMWFANNKALSRRQASWALGLDTFEFRIIHHPGVKNCKPDALCRGAKFQPEKTGQGY